MTADRGDRPFFSDSSEDDESDNDERLADDIVQLDEDHELLLKSCIPLLQSRNSGVCIPRWLVNTTVCC